MDSDEQRHLMWRTDLTRAELAELLDRDEKTVDAYARGRPMPRATRYLVEILAGRMPWRGCEGFELRRGVIYPPGLADGVAVQQLPVLHWQLTRLHLLEREVETLKRVPAQYLLEFGPGAD